jgi:hypothetical protein
MLVKRVLKRRNQIPFSVNRAGGRKCRGSASTPACPRTTSRLCRYRIAPCGLVTADGPLRVFTLLHDARSVLLNLGEPGGFDITPWAAA